MSYVLLQCVKKGSKLRVQMISSHPFIKGINCQFPRNIRQNGMYYVVKQEGVKLKNNFYSAMQKDIIVCQTFSLAEVKLYIDNLKDDRVVPKAIFGEDGDDECIVCLYNNKQMVFSPCGHFITCPECSGLYKKCPLCTKNITHIFDRGEIKD
jgi:hypothetical protein